MDPRPQPGERTKPMTRNFQTCLIAALALLLGWQLHSRSNTVQAQTQYSGDIYYHLQSMGGDSALTLYYPSTQTIYVYPGAVVGNSVLNCAFMFKLGKPGEQIQRIQCPIGTMR
jgi:hypothetical protein